MIGESRVSEKFRFAVWSKMKYSEELNNNMLEEKLQTRFEAVLPYIKIDVIFVEKSKEGLASP
jgi:hypothetical protein